MIGARVREYRKARGLTMSELADRAGVAKSYLSAIERDLQSNPSIQFLEKIASVLDVNMNALLKDASAEDEAAALDDEWQQLISEAMNSGVSKEEFRDFLEYNKWKMKQK
ncbi:helix-turn-helix domain-containing protein [Alkalicoccus halolimnae]|jgi:XRE family transcriptional regulator, master regulator for biofilm formation|uniref:Helix-turn-helix domain-containing protein n=1 Tax=Alkalicoccus halolimnae TaxID=1667239 RepID=A0A5C7FGI0_9BACI|nr:helix-turn-helix domain-containing protein [Alkalicoccus halolimnae]TXF86407.1 helix-turn-helix domain-containing protein [Alkalicoccus halolimnae]